MAPRWRYRITSVAGTAVLTALAVWVANLTTVQQLFGQVPYFGRPAPAVLSNGDLTGAVSTTLVVTLAAMWPVFKPRPRRILDTILLTQKRVMLAMVGLAALGYYNYSYRLPRPTLMVATAVLLVVLPALTVSIRRRPSSQSRAVIVGDDPEAMEAILASVDIPVLGYVSPPSSYATGEERVAGAPEMADGGTVRRQLGELSNLGGLSRLDEVFVKHDVDTALIAFTATDREEFFGTLAQCHEHGVTAKVHREHADSVLTEGIAGGDIVDIDLEPWDWQDHVAKRAFDVAFSLSALLVLSPVMLVIAVAVKLDSPGPVLYAQKRTAEFGDTFTVYKFRTLKPVNEDADLDIEQNRRTALGDFLRTTHLDEIPQLWSILVGDMSVVGPRPAQTELETEFEAEAQTWKQRWFVKPGLTGLAQINDATSSEPSRKIDYDIAYIRKQSFVFDVKIVLRQVWSVVSDVVDLVTSR